MILTLPELRRRRDSVWRRQRGQRGGGGRERRSRRRWRPAPSAAAITGAVLSIVSCLA